jgi:hypothetical protein
MSNQVTGEQGNINFEICVTAEDSSEKGKSKGLGIVKVFTANIDSKEQDSMKNINANKISFSVPFYPYLIE